MLKRTLAIAALALASLAQAAPFLYCKEYPPTGPQPDSFTISINGAAAVACPMETNASGVRSKCDLGALPLGTHTLLLSACTNGSITNTASGAVNVQAGCVPASPFSYARKTLDVAGPTPSVGP